MSANAPLERRRGRRIRDRRRPLVAGAALAASLWLPTAFAQGSAVDVTEEERAPRDAAPPTTEIMVTVRFDFGASVPDAASRESLERVARLVREDRASRVRLAAHTDSRGWSLGNLELSRQRARAVARALVALGVDLSRITAWAYGETVPIAPNATPEGRRRNRRVEISLLR